MSKTPKGITISFTNEEVKWLSWAMQEGLGTYSHCSPVSLAASNKIVQAANLIELCESVGEQGPSNA